MKFTRGEDAKTTLGLGNNEPGVLESRMVKEVRALVLSKMDSFIEGDIENLKEEGLNIYTAPYDYKDELEYMGFSSYDEFSESQFGSNIIDSVFTALIDAIEDGILQGMRDGKIEEAQGVEEGSEEWYEIAEMHMDMEMINHDRAVLSFIIDIIHEKDIQEKIRYYEDLIEERDEEDEY